jgi:pimeloyl-ACP methyl ester carboxylesterase
VNRFAAAIARAAIASVVAAPLFAVAALPPPAARETIPGVDVIYTDAEVGNGDRVRLIVTRPSGISTPLPVAFIVGWLSCDSVSWPKGPSFGFAHAIVQIARESGFVTVRMEKPGVGDSRGPRCAELDFDRELAAYRAALEATMRMPGVDATRIFIVGMSNGGGFAPLVADHATVRGYVVVGGWVKTWYEHMLEHERRRLDLSRESPGAVNAAMARYATLYHAFLIEGHTPGEVLRTHLELRPLWYDTDDGQYGRPAVFFQQLQRLNLAEAWSRVRVPTLVIHGERDWVMSADDHRMIARIVAANGVDARLIEAPGLNHLLERLDDSARFDASGRYEREIGTTIVRWLQQQATR